MYKELEIGGKTIAFLSNGATPLYYKHVFHADLLKNLNGDGLEIASDKIPEMGFIMAKQADKADMMKLTYEMYVEWLTGFEPLDLVLKGGEIANVYISDSIPSEEPKKKAKGEVSE